MKITKSIVHIICKTEKRRFNTILKHSRSFANTDHNDSIYVYKKNPYVLVIAPHYGDKIIIYLNINNKKDVGFSSVTAIRKFIREYFNELLQFGVGVHKDIIKFYDKGWLKS